MAAARRRLRAARERARRAAVPLPVLRPLGEILRARWQGARRHWSRWRLAFLAVVLLEAWYARGDPASRVALAAWLLAGSLAWGGASLAEADLAARRAAHGRSSAPAVRGWRLAGTLGAMDPDLLLALDLTLYLHDTAEVVARPRRGHRAGTRITYAVGLRELARRWARSRGLPVRRGDAVARQLVAVGVIREVTLSQARAWRLGYASAPEALRALERATGRPMVAWELGRDPDWTATQDPPSRLA